MLSDSFDTLGDGVLGELTRENKADSGLILAGGDVFAAVDGHETRYIGVQALKHVIHGHQSTNTLPPNYFYTNLNGGVEKHLV